MGSKKQKTCAVIAGFTLASIIAVIVILEKTSNSHNEQNFLKSPCPPPLTNLTESSINEIASRYNLSSQFQEQLRLDISNRTGLINFIEGNFLNNEIPNLITYFKNKSNSDPNTSVNMETAYRERYSGISPMQLGLFYNVFNRNTSNELTYGQLAINLETEQTSMLQEYTDQLNELNKKMCDSIKDNLNCDNAQKTNSRSKRNVSTDSKKFRNTDLAAREESRISWQQVQKYRQNKQKHQTHR